MPLATVANTLTSSTYASPLQALARGAAGRAAPAEAHQRVHHLAQGRQEGRRGDEELVELYDGRRAVAAAAASQRSA